MRIRQIKPSFWTDKVMARLPARTRLTYIGLWGLADDAGWLRWDLAQAGAELAPFDGVKRRERDLEADMALLVAAERVQLFDCGHACIPSLPRHQRVGGRPVYTVRDEHARGCAHLRADGSQQEPTSTTVGNGRVGKGRERDVTESNGPDGQESEFRRKVQFP